MSYTSGLYSWAGPGTVRMIQLKYPGQRIDIDSVMAGYDYDNLKAAKENLRLSDVWVTFSWGFSEQTEQEDYQFIREKLPTFQELGLRTHAYVQGPNLVLSEHSDEDYYCRDYRGRLVPYHRGRKMACVNNPKFRGYIRRKIELALDMDFEGIYVDNLFFGLMPLVVGNKFVSGFGCYCNYCKQLFKKDYGSSLPDYFETNSNVLKDYINYREDSLFRFSKELSDLVKQGKKDFGSNSFDPKFDPIFFYGHDLQKLAKVQDYLLLENHSLPNGKKNNSYLKPLIDSLGKTPVGLVSYRDGIGREPFFSQADFDLIFTESKILGYMPIYKGSEFTVNGVWKNFDFSQIDPVSIIEGVEFPSYDPKSVSLPGQSLIKIYNYSYSRLLEWYFEKPLMRKIGDPIFYRAVG